MVERQDRDNFTRFLVRECCALELAAYVFKNTDAIKQEHSNGHIVFVKRDYSLTERRPKLSYVNVILFKKFEA